MIHSPPTMNAESANALPTVDVPLAHLIARLPKRLMANSTPIKPRNVSVFTLNSCSASAQALSGKATRNSVETKKEANTPQAMDAVMAWVTPT
ncbi:Uncharacterised protein [Mycobacterium tuberculosis]|uniref:Uncharacterized protein n=1 Tax=Mycobacterium tuberculosis TaxID=1773 RepID=A0A654TWL1_MYCTX|nr:Uncharacterised protein [Mycobacterium tuberculosis]CFS29778.1 Uncharacterised protein [Mycobacterium tuberculosis]CNM98849.1 Uncharacterised protein [Mycobacterium tuberculosis]